MRLIPVFISFIATAAFACGNMAMGCGQNQGGCSAMDMQQGCGCSKHNIPLLETITYALGELGLADNSDVRTALKLYKKEMRTLKPRVPTDAFENGVFNAVVYARNASSTQALQAQIDLFDTLYLILDDEQKQKFPQLMGMYQHHMEFITLPKICTGPFAKNGNCMSGMGKMCHMQMGQMPSADKPMKKMKATPKR